MDSCIDTSGGRRVGVIEGCGLQRTVRNHPPIEYLSWDHIKVLVDAEDLYASGSEVVTMSKVTNISVTWETHTRLSEIGKKGESFDHIVERLLDSYEVRK